MKFIINILLILIVVTPFTVFSVISYIAFLILAGYVIIISFTNNSLKINKKMSMVLFFLMSLFVVILLAQFFNIDRNFDSSISDLVKRMVVVIFTIIIITNLELKTLLNYFNTLIRNLFFVGILCLTYFLLTDVNIINENAVSFFILPYCGYIVYKQKHLGMFLISYIGFSTILYLSSGRAAFLAFLITPLLIIITKYRVLKILFFILVSALATAIQIIFIEKLNFLNNASSGRINIQEKYITEIFSNYDYIFFGSGEFILGEDIFDGLGTHQTWLGLMWTYGIIGTLINLVIIIYLLRFKVDKQFFYLHLIAMYICVVQFFEIINLGGVSYLSWLLLITLIIPLKYNNENYIK